MSQPRYWQFAQLSDAYKFHNDLDQIPQAGKLFIGGLKAIDKLETLERRGITHILSVLEYDHCDYEEYSKYQRLWLSVEDHPGENLLQHFDKTNAFIERALAADGSVLVHCAMGVSRSATIVCAYLMQRASLTFSEAVGQVQEARPLCSPNLGFLEQLEVYGRILNASDQAEKQSIYAKWLFERSGPPKL